MDVTTVPDGAGEPTQPDRGVPLPLDDTTTTGTGRRGYAPPPQPGSPGNGAKSVAATLAPEEIQEAFRVQDQTIFKLLVKGLPPYTFVVEAVRNSIEASAHANRAVTVDVRPCLNNQGKIIGTTVVDDGPGMTKREMEDRLIEMGRSGHEIRPSGNLGLGLKLTGGFMNDEVVIRSWRGDRCYRVVYGNTAPEDQPERIGARLQTDEDDRRARVVACEKPTGVTSYSGTQVDFISRRGYMPKRLQDFLNGRLIRLNLQEGYQEGEVPRDDTVVRVHHRVQGANNAPLPVVGLLPGLSSKCETFGVVKGTTANFYWGVLKEQTEPQSLPEQLRARRELPANLRFAWRDEAFQSGQPGELTNDWAIEHGSDRFVLIVEFKGDHIGPDPSRKTIDKFAKLRRSAMREWADLMPDEVVDYQAQRSQQIPIFRGDQDLLSALVTAWEPGGQAVISTRKEGADSRERRGSHVGESDSERGRGTGRGGEGETGRGRGGVRGPRVGGRGGSEIVEDDELDGEQELKRGQRYVPFATVKLEGGMGAEPVIYNFSLLPNAHTIKINSDFGPVARILDAARAHSERALKVAITLIEYEIRYAINEHFKSVSQKEPTTEELLGRVASLSLASAYVKDPDGFKLPKITKPRRKAGD